MLKKEKQHIYGVANIIKKFRGDLAGALARTFAARGVASFGSFILVVVLGRMYGASGVGVFALAQSLVMAISVLGRWGMNNALIRFIGRDVSSPKVYAYLKYASIKTIIISIIGMVFVFFARGLVADIFSSPNLPSLLVGIAISIPAFVLAYLLSGFMAAINKPATACFLQNGAVSFVAASVLLILNGILGYSGLVSIGVAYAAAAWVVCLWGVWTTFRWLRNNSTKRDVLDESDILEFKRSSSAFLATDVASFIMSVAGIWMAGYWLSDSMVGLYKSALQISMLIDTILRVINLIIPTRFSRFFHTGNLVALESLARKGVVIGLSLALIPIVICLFFPNYILQVLGNEFVDARQILGILIIGQIFNLGCGSVGHLLNMTGHEPLSRNIAWLGNGLGLAVLIVGTPLFGVNAVAVGVTIAIATRKIVGTYCSWRKLGIWMLPIPNVLRKLGISVEMA